LAGEASYDVIIKLATEVSKMGFPALDILPLTVVRHNTAFLTKREEKP